MLLNVSLEVHESCLLFGLQPSKYHQLRCCSLCKYFVAVADHALFTAGHEPEYTSSHTQFMDTCDYIWYTEQATAGSSSSSSNTVFHSNGMPVNSSVSSNGTAELPSQDVVMVDSDSGSGGRRSATQTSTHIADDGRYGQYILQPVAVLLPPDGRRLKKGLPSRYFGSDHVCLVTDFHLTKQPACYTNTL